MSSWCHSPKVIGSPRSGAQHLLSPRLTSSEKLDGVWVAMITSDRGQQLHGDATIGDLTAAGLPAPSRLRASKIATIEVGHILRWVGRLSDPDRNAAMEALKACSAL